MELRELTEKTNEIFETPNTSQLSEKLFDVCVNNKTEYYEKFVELVEDLSIDWLQKIFQYYEADRKEKMQDYTPLSLARFVGKLAEHENEKTCYDLCAGSGALTIQKWNQNNNLQFVCYEYDEKAIPFLLFNLSIRNVEATVIHGDALQDKAFKIYNIQKSEKYSIVCEIENDNDLKCDSCISNPPYNMKWEPPTFAQLQDRFNDCELPPKSNANYAFVLTALNNINQSGKLSMILPRGVLSTDNKQEKEIRKYLINKNLVESVILCPDKMFEATSIPTCLVTFNKSKTTSNVVFVDMRQAYETEQREQNGQFGGASHENRTYKKEVKVISEEQMQKAVDCIAANTNVVGFSKAVSIEDIASQDYTLVPSRYIEFEEKETEHRPYKDIVNDILRINREKNVVKITANEVVAKNLGIYEIAENLKKSNEDAEQMIKTFKMLGVECESLKEDYVILSKNKNELKIENKDKEVFSSAITMFMAMWKQHIFYLNQEENRLLAELRDAMLPDLMSGKLTIGEVT